MNNYPVIIIGAGCPQPLADYLCTLGIPVLTTWQGADRVPECSPVFCGRPGVVGMRAANIIQQKATVVYVFGARMDMEQVGHRIDNFAPKAIKHAYDIDTAELDKLPAGWVIHQYDLNCLTPLLSELATVDTTGSYSVANLEPNPRWLAWCRALYDRFRPELDGANVIEDFVDPYYFVRRLGEACEEGEVIVPGSSGMQSCAMMQAFKAKRGQRILLCNTIGAMGLEPMAIGAALATDRRVICVTGDGGFFMNMQELEVVKRLGLNIKYFVFCNGGYGSITTMQDARFNLRVGADPSSGFTLPDLARVAAVWGFAYYEINSNAQMDCIEGILKAPHASITRVSTTLAFRYVCKVNSSLKDGVFETDDMADMTPKIADLQEVMDWDG